MASAKVSGRARLKDDKGKYLNSNGSGDEPDSSLLRKPVQTSITGFAQARKIFDTATEELKGLLTTECDLLYECKVCRNMFRSLANFISHKRVYCKETFNASVHGHFIKSASTALEISKIKQLEDGYQEFLRSINQQAPVAPLERVPLSRDLTEVLENVTKSKEAPAASAENESDLTPGDNALEVALQDIPSSKAAVFQNLVTNDDSGDDMRTQITELDKIAAKDKAVLKEDGKFEVCADIPERNDSEQVIQISDDDDVNQLNCKICDLQFSTRKTLRFHMKYKHVADRLVYPCTDCCDVFATSWSVLRHLYRVHRRTLTQIRRMRELVQSRAFRMNNMPSSYIKKKNNKKMLMEQKLTDEERMDQENQAWMDNMETDSELPRCGGCGRSFERRAALAAHTYTCQSRTRALARKSAHADRRAELPAKRDKPVLKTQQTTQNSAEMLTIKQVKPSIMEKEVKEEEPGEADEMEIELEDEATDAEENGKEDSDSEGESKSVMLNFPAEIEKENMDALKKRMADYVDDEGTCKVCKRKYLSPSHLCRHMSSHLFWRRYGCKLCSYVNYDKNRLVIHAQGVHKLKGSDEFYVSIIKALSAEEALALSSSPKLMQDEWKDTREVESSDSSGACGSSDSERESTSSRTEPVKLNRRKQTFNAVKVVKSNKVVANKEEEKAEKAGVKRPPQIPLDKVMQVILGDSDTTDKSRPKASADKEGTDEATLPGTGSRRPVRKRMRPKKDEDFEYDFSNVMRWEASSYKDTDKNARTITSKRKSQVDTSPNDSSPEKSEKQDKAEKEKAKDDKSQKQEKPAEKKPYSGALATMSNAAIAQSRAHPKPALLPNPCRLTFVMKRVPFDVRRANFGPGSRLAVAQEAQNQTPEAPFSGFKTPQTTDKDIAEEADIEKQIDEANAMNKVAKTSNVALIQLKNKQPIKKQKLIVMKRVNSGGEASQSGCKIQFPSIVSIGMDKIELKSPIVPIKLPPVPSIVEKEKERAEVETISEIDSTEKLTDDAKNGTEAKDI